MFSHTLRSMTTLFDACHLQINSGSCFMCIWSWSRAKETWNFRVKLSQIWSVSCLLRFPVLKHTICVDAIICGLMVLYLITFTGIQQMQECEWSSNVTAGYHGKLEAVLKFETLKDILISKAVHIYENALDWGAP